MILEIFKINNARYLYRGVNKELFEKLNGELIPKLVGQKFSSEPRCGEEHVRFGSGIELGDSVVNEIIKHQYAQKGLPTSGISTTPHYEKALFYASSNGEYDEGYIYTISTNELEKHSVSIYRISDYIDMPDVPEDDEHIIVASDNKKIPKKTIQKIEHIVISEGKIVKKILF